MPNLESWDWGLKISFVVHQLSPPMWTMILHRTHQGQTQTQTQTNTHPDLVTPALHKGKNGTGS